MPEWTAFGWKSRTRVAPFGAPGSAPPPPQPSEACSEEGGRQQRGDPSHPRLTLYARVLRGESRGATRFIRAHKGFAGGRGACSIPVRLRAARQAGGQFDAYEEVASSARSRSRRVYRRTARHAVPGLLHHQRRRALRGDGPELPVRIGLRGRGPGPLPRALRADHQHRRGERRALQPRRDARPSSRSGGSIRSTASSTSSPSSRAASSAHCSPRRSCSTRGVPRTTARRRSARCSAAPSRASSWRASAPSSSCSRCSPSPSTLRPGAGPRSRSAARLASW